MLDHMGFRVRDLVAARRFYDAYTAPLGFATIDNTAESLIGRSADPLFVHGQGSRGGQHVLRRGHLGQRNG